MPQQKAPITAGGIAESTGPHYPPLETVVPFVRRAPDLSESIDAAAPFAALNLCRVSGAEAYQASLQVSGNAFRIRVAPTPSEAIRQVLGAGIDPPPPPY